MEDDIETFVVEDSNPSDEVDFDLITRYYQSLLSQIENGIGRILVRFW